MLLIPEYKCAGSRQVYQDIPAPIAYMAML